MTTDIDRHRRSRRSWITITLIAIAGLLAFVFAGLLGTRYGKSFNFDAASVVATAIATAALAAFTAVLATSTQADAAASREAVELSRQDQRDRNRGVVVVLRAELVDRGNCNVDIKNVGLGPAVYITARVETRDHAGTPLTAGYSSNDYALAPSEDSQLKIKLSPTSEFTQEAKVDKVLVWGTFLGRVVYGEFSRTESAVEHFLWSLNPAQDTFGLWGEAANSEAMRRVVGRDDWAQLHR